MYEIRNRLPDNNGNPYPTREEFYINVSETANSNHEYKKLIVKKFILTALGVSSDGTCDHIVGLLWGGFKAHS